MPTFTLRVTGNATLTKTAAQANLRVAVSSDGPNKQAATDQVRTTAKYIEDMLQTVQTQKASVSPASWTQTSLSIDTWIEHVPRHLAHGQDIVGNGSGASLSGGSLFGYNNPFGLDSKDADVVPVHRYRARIVFDVCFQDFNILYQFKSHLSSIDHCEISGLEWKLPPHDEERLKSQLRTKAAEDASNKVVDYCRVVCPGHDHIVIVPTELGSEHITGGSVPVPSRLDRPQGMLFSTGNPGLVPSSQMTLGDGKPASSLSSTSTAYKTDLGCTPQEISMALSVDFVFTVDTKGFKLSTKLDETSQSMKLET